MKTKSERTRRELIRKRRLINKRRGSVCRKRRTSDGRRLVMLWRDRKPMETGQLEGMMKPKDIMINNMAIIRTTIMATNREDTQIRDVAILEVMTIRAEIIKIMRDKDNRVDKTVAIGTVTIVINREGTQIHDMAILEAVAILEVMVTRARIIRTMPNKNMAADYIKKDARIRSAAILEIVATKMSIIRITPATDRVMDCAVCTAYLDQSNKQRRSEKHERQMR